MQTVIVDPPGQDADSKQPLLDDMEEHLRSLP